MVLTIGHSTRSLADFIALLSRHGVREVVDVRTIPKSRRNPQFHQDFLPGSLREAGLEYLHLPGLGGLRRTSLASPNTGWRNTSFRGYADYMQTPEFAQAISELVALAGQKQIAIMCAEAVPWRCHRWLIADALLVRGVPVEHIMSLSQRRPHTLTPFARIRRTSISYPPVEGAEPPRLSSTRAQMHGVGRA